MATKMVGRNFLRPSSSLLHDLVRKRDFYAGGLMLLLGLFIALKGLSYRAGTLMHMGPGFLPTALGVILAVLGIVLVIGALAPVEPGHEDEQRILPDNPQWWGWFCILMSPVAFIIFGYEFGLLPATFACVFVAALGDKDATWKSTLALSSVITAFGFVFAYFLQLSMPMLTWRGGL
jgi:putative Ca2+/H+ antiporter (TMEM165/GDT1 family)